MFDKEKLGQLKKSHEQWENNVNAKVVAKQPERKKEFETSSGIKVKRAYTPEDIEMLD